MAPLAATSRRRLPARGFATSSRGKKTALLRSLMAPLAFIQSDISERWSTTRGGSTMRNARRARQNTVAPSITVLAFGVAFLFPVIVLFLNFVGIFPTRMMRSWRRGMIVGIAVASAVLTPSQDPFTFMAMALPLYALYEGCIVIARIRERASRRRRAVEPGAQELERLGDDETSRVEDRPSPL